MALDGVVAVMSLQQIMTPASQQRVVAVFSGEAVISGSAVERIAGGAAD